jgi:GGDEF domain-containing protein
VTDALRTPRAPRARPVADLPIEALLGRADEFARRWAIALVIDCPLERLSEIPLEDLARSGPALVAQLLRALVADAELERIGDDGASSGRERQAWAAQFAATVGARDAAAIVMAVEALRGALWEGLLEALARPSARLLADTSDRLALVCASALAATLSAATEMLAPVAPDGAEESLAAQASPAPRGSTGAAALIVDEHPDAAQPAAASPAHVAGTVLGADDVEEPLLAIGGERRAEIEIRDERGEQGPAAWIGSIGRALERFAEDGLPFAVLLVELREIETLRRAGGGELSRIANQVEDALAVELGDFAPGGVAHRAERGLDRAPRLGSLTREVPGRYWLLAPETNRLSARRLAERLARAAASSGSWQGASLEVVVGAAICPEDGREAAVLAAHADVGLYADRASLTRQGS